MGGSSPCLVRTFSQPSPTFAEENEGNPMQRSLTTSVSFGRFMSESLDWGKWSAFTHNRYLEEVERYSKPGSVAEKKAYFEAHFKRRRAAALLKQQIAEASSFSESNMEDKVEDNKSSCLDLIAENLDEGKVQSSDPVVRVDQNGNYDALVEKALEDEKPKGIEEVMEPLVLMEDPTNHVETDGCIGDIVSKIEDNVCNKDDATLTNGSASKCESSVKVIKPVRLKTPDSKSKELSNKRRSFTTSLHMSINCAPFSGPIRKNSSSDVQKIENSRTVRAPPKQYKNSLHPRTSTRASANIFKYHSATPQAENNRIIRQPGDSISGAKTVDEKVQSTSTNYFKSSNISGIKAQAPTIPSSFKFKSEERVAKRREFFEKLEQQSKLKETEKHQITAKPQVKARSTDKDLRNSIAFETTKNADFPSRNLTKKVPTLRTCFQKIEERTAFQVHNSNGSRPPWRFPMKMTEGSKPLQSCCYSAKCSTKKSMNENASPNINIQL